MGFKGVITEGASRIMHNRPVNHLYGDLHDTRMKIFLRNRSLSNDIGYRFCDKRWTHFPLQPNKYLSWLENSDGPILNICMDFEVLGERYSSHSGIFDFFEKTVAAIVSSPKMQFSLPSVAAEELEVFDVLDVYDPVTWTDKDNDLSVFRGNAMQTEALGKIYELGKDIVMTKNRKLMQTWLSLLASDHFYYMSTKGDGSMRNYFSPYRSPYDAYVYYMNILNDLEQKIRNDDYFLSTINGLKMP
jgi:alpha-amylase